MNGEKFNNEKRKNGLGFFHVLDDDMLLELLEFMDEKALLNLSLVSYPFYIFAEEEDLWKTLCIRKFVSNKFGYFTFKGSWKRTTLLPREKKVTKPYCKLALNGFYSSRLYTRWYRAHVPLETFSTCTPGIDKRYKLSVEEFIKEYESINKPVVLTGLMDNWKAKGGWKINQLLAKYENTYLKTNGTDSDGHSFRLLFKDYVAYMEGNHDEKPIYLFDNKFQERAPDLLTDYQVPPYFRDDLFDLMTNEDRPDYRWFLCGPSRSGSPLHQDPHRTSAWNALLQGRKRWTIWPPDVIPPGVDKDLIDTEFYASPDVMKWFVDVYPKVRDEQRPLEIIQEEGEVIFVPSGWWHQVLNLTDTVAVTQNYCSPRNFKYVYQDMINRKSRSLRKQFYRAVYPVRPDLFKGFPEFIDVVSSSSSESSDSETESRSRVTEESGSVSEEEE